MPTIKINWADNTSELRANLAKGLNQIEATRAAAEKMAKSLGGENLLRAAGTYAAAVEKLGGAANLTASNQARVNSVMVKAVEQLEAAGRGSSELANHYRTLAQQTAQVDKATSGAVDRFGAIRAPLATATNLLGAFGVGMSVSAAVGFGKSLLDLAGQIEDLSSATGVSTTGLQKFAYVGSSVGVGMDEIGRAVGTLSERLAGGDKSAADAVAKLGLNMDALLAMGPEQAFTAIGDAVGRIEDPMQKNAIAADLFGGKLSRQLIPLLGNLTDAMNDVPQAAIISQEQLDAADAFGDKLDQLILTWKAWAATQVFPTTRKFELQMPPDADLQTKAQLLRDLGVAEKENWAAIELATQATEREKIASDAMARARMAELGPAIELGAAVNLLSDGLHEQSRASDEAVASGKRHEVELERQREAAERLTDSLWKSMQAVNQMRLRAGGTPLTEVLDPLATAPSRPQIPTLQSGPNASLPRSFGQNFGDMLRTSLPQAINNAIQGGGSLIESAGSTLGGFLTSAQGFGKQMTSGLTKMLGDGLGAAASALLPGIGSLLGPLLGKLTSLLAGAFGGPSKQEREGREAEAAFEQRFQSFDDMVNRVGDAYAATGRSREDAQRAVQEMLDAERQGADAVNAAIANLQGTLDAADRLREGASRFGMTQSERRQAVQDAQEIYDYMARLQQQGEYTQEQVNAAYLAYQQALADAGNEAAKAWLATQGAVVNGTAAVTNQLQSQIDTLQKSIAGEAAEPVKGAIQEQVEGQIAALKAEMESQQSSLEANAQASAENATQAIEDAFADLELHVPIVFDMPRVPGMPVEMPEVVPMDEGGAGRAKGPMLFYTAGNEDYAFSGEGRSFGSNLVPSGLMPGGTDWSDGAAQRAIGPDAATGGGVGTLVVQSVIDRRVISEVVIQDLPATARRMGVA